MPSDEVLQMKTRLCDPDWLVTQSEAGCYRADRRRATVIWYALRKFSESSS